MKKVVFSFRPYIAGVKEEREVFEYPKDTSPEEINEDFLEWMQNHADFGVTEIE